jgi:hypothetical protein
MVTYDEYIKNLNIFLKDQFLSWSSLTIESREDRVRYAILVLGCFPDSFFDNICVYWKKFVNDKNIQIEYSICICTFLSNLDYFESTFLECPLQDEKFDLFLEELVYVVTLYLSWVVEHSNENT